MKIRLINYFVCPLCHGNFLFSIHKKTNERVIEGKLKCEKCGKKFYIKNGIACFVSRSRCQTANMQKLRKITLKQEMPKTWMKLFSKRELAALRKEWDWMSSVIKKQKSAVHLDFATGTGRFLRNIIPKTKGEIIALEHDYPTCLELQYFLEKIKKYSQISIVCADARGMPFKKGVFDSVTSWHGLDEPKMEKAINESKRVLRNGAWLAASGLHYQKGSKSFLIAKKENIRFITREIIIETLKKVSFQKIEHRIFFHGIWDEKESHLPALSDFYSNFAIKTKK